MDQARGYTLRLFNDSMYMRGGNPGLERLDEFTKYYTGRWVK